MASHDVTEETNSPPSLDELVTGPLSSDDLEASGVLEQITVSPVPPSHRGGRLSSQFTLWVSANLTPLGVLTGSLAVVAFELSFVWSFVAIAIGVLVGTIFFALHAAQGPRLGVPQMVQARGQFGFVGAILVIAVVLIEIIGFNASNLVVGAEILHQAVPGISIDLGIVLVSLMSFAAVVYGYGIIHKLNRYAAWVFGLTFIVATVLIFTQAPIPTNYFEQGGFNAGGFLAMMAVAAVWPLSFAPFVSDYSRYLPENVSARATFWWSYAGASIGAIAAFMLGAAVALVAIEAELFEIFGQYTVGLSGVVLVVLFLAQVDSNILNTYTGVLSSIAGSQIAKPSWNPRAKGRIVFAAIIVAISFTIAYAAKDSFLSHFENFVLFLIYILIPWTAINLVDYYLICRGRYRVEDFFKSSGGIYGRVNWLACTLYLVGIAVEAPFMNTEFYQGPVSKSLEGADLSWIVGLVVIGPAYYIGARILRRRERLGLDEP